MILSLVGVTPHIQMPLWGLSVGNMTPSVLRPLIQVKLQNKQNTQTVKVNGRLSSRLG